MTLLQAEQLRVALQGKPVLHGVDFTLHPGEMVGLIGPNGAGKSTLLRCLARLLPPDSGTLRWQHQPADSIPPRQWARQLGYLAQSAPAHWPLPVERVVALGREPHGSANPSHNRQAVEQALRQAEVEHLRQRPLTQLSGGERLRVLLARVFAGEPQAILADEPVAALDPYHQLHIMELLADHAHQGGAVIAVMHDLNLAARFCSRLVLLHQGRIAADDHPCTLLENPTLSDVFGIEMRRFGTGAEQAILPWRRSREHS